MNMIRRAAHGRYLKRLAVAMGCYMATLYLAITQVRDGDLTGPLAWLLAILPGLSVAAIFWAVGRLMVEETDEYQRMLVIRQVLVATGFTLTIVTIYGFLENFGLVAHVDAFYIAILWFIGLAVGAVANRIKLGASGGL